MTITIYNLLLSQYNPVGFVRFCLRTQCCASARFSWFVSDWASD